MGNHNIPIGNIEEGGQLKGVSDSIEAMRSTKRRID